MLRLAWICWYIIYIFETLLSTANYSIKIIFRNPFLFIFNFFLSNNLHFWTNIRRGYIYTGLIERVLRKFFKIFMSTIIFALYSTFYFNGLFFINNPGGLRFCKQIAIPWIYIWCFHLRFHIILFNCLKRFWLFYFNIWLLYDFFTLVLNELILNLLLFIFKFFDFSLKLIGILWFIQSFNLLKFNIITLLLFIFWWS